MNRFCEKCGTPLNLQTGRCPKCSDLEYSHDQEFKGHTRPKATFLKILTLALLVLFLTCSLLGILIHFNFISFSSSPRPYEVIIPSEERTPADKVELDSDKAKTEHVQETVHTHNWQDATCTKPKTCIDCGITEGEATGHDWIAATTKNPKTCSLCSATEGSPILDIVAGDTITMGYYGNENIIWTVLEFDPATNQALLISKYCLDAIPFHAGSDYGSWENSTLRRWLNNDFISKAFDQEERESILTKTISNPRNADYGTDSGRDTSDRVFLLSYEEAVYYFPSNTSRQCKPTDYCKEQGCYDPVKYGEEHGTEVSPEAVGYTWWWLRTAGLDEKHTCNVVAKGTASTYGAYKTSNEGGVRPAMWVQLGQ